LGQIRQIWSQNGCWKVSLQIVFKKDAQLFRPDKKNHSGQNLSTLPLKKDILLATTDGFSRFTGPKWGRAYHGNITEHDEQSEVWDTHSSIPWRFVASSEGKTQKAERGTYKRLDLNTEKKS
jgi:hypothetical protein